jgi:broad specificity phosphatase PhoE
MNHRMSILYFMPTGETTFEQQSRVESTAGAPLTEQGVEQVTEVLHRLSAQHVDAVYCSPGEAERQTAQLAGKALRAKVRLAPNLRELDYGLWQGLTVEEIRRRQPKVWRQWNEAPGTVCPPGGETLEEVQARLRKTVKGILKRHKDESPLLVLRPLALGLLRCSLEGEACESVWQRVPDGETLWRYEVTEKQF